jgi:predicted nucleic acid-binding Zn finger protein
MKPYKMTPAINKTDRVEKAVAIIEQGKVYTHTNGTFRVLTERFAGGYTVTTISCDCDDFTINLKGQEPCKHMWAAIGATAARLIQAIRKAETLKALEATGLHYANAMTTLPDVFVNIARTEYRNRYDYLVAESHKDERLAILIKPQPKSNGHYNGIEI